MRDDRDTEVTFDGASARLNGLVREPVGPPKAALVVAHGRNADREEPLVAGLARHGSELGLWTLRFNFGFREADAEPSAGFEDEIADLREAVAFARHRSALGRVIVAGRGLGAWAAVAAATDEDAEDAILLGLSYEGQPARRVALERLAEFDLAALVVVGSASDRADIPALRELFASMSNVRFEIIEGADHRLRDARGETLTGPVLDRSETWIRERLA